MEYDRNTVGSHTCHSYSIWTEKEVILAALSTCHVVTWARWALGGSQEYLFTESYSKTRPVSQLLGRGVRGKNLDRLANYQE